MSGTPSFVHGSSCFTQESFVIRREIPEVMLETELRSWLIRSGFPPDIGLTAMARGLGKNELWSISSSDTSMFVVRVFPKGADGAAEREYVAMDAVARHSLPVPAVVARGAVAGRPVLVSTFISGTLAFQMLDAHPDQAHELGLTIGEIFGQLHQIAAPARLRAGGDSWIDRGGPALSSIRHLLEAVPNQDRLLHLDYHPKNLLIRDGRVVGIVDWENALPGPPHMDLARSRAILRAAVFGGPIPAERQEAAVRFEQGLVVGHTKVIGADLHPDLSTAWGLAMTVEDLTKQMHKPGVFVTHVLLARLMAERDALIRSLQARNVTSQS